MAAAAIPLIISGISGLAGGLLNQNKKQTQTGRQNTAGSSLQNNYNIPTYDSYGEELRQALINAYGGTINQDPDLTGYQAQGQSNINQMADVRGTALRNSLASRGLSYSPIAPLAQQQNDNARISDHAQFLNSIPLLQQQLQQQRLTNASTFFKGLPVSTHQLNQGNQQSGTESFQEGTIPGNSVGGGIDAFGTTLAGLYGQGAFGGPKKPGFSGNQTGPR